MSTYLAADLNYWMYS